MPLRKHALALVDFDWKADTRPLHQTIDSIRATNPAAMPSIANYWLICALAERDAAAAKDALIASGENANRFASENVLFNRPFVEGVIARMTKDDDKARSAFTAARAEQEKIVQAQPNYGPALCVLGLIDAGLGRKEEALREGRRAVELLPVEKDAIEWHGHDQIFGDDRCVGWRQRSRLRTACHCHPPPKHPQLWPIETAAVLGSAARRSAL